jgi:hypothetical protein
VVDHRARLDGQRVTRRLLALFALVVVLAVSTGVRAAGTVTNADLGSLNAALAGGGTVVCAFDGAITLTNTLTITQDTALDGTGHQVTLDGNNQVRLFVVNTNVTLTLMHLTLTHGLATAPPTNGPSGIPCRGGAVENDGGIINAQGCAFSANEVRGEDCLLLGGTAGDGLGGDIFNWGGILNLVNTEFSASQALGGNLSGAPGVSQDPAAAGYGRGEGGSIFIQSGALNLANCSFSGCNVRGGAWGDYPLNLSGLSYPLGAAYGGAVFLETGSLMASNCVFSGNRAGFGSGLIYVASSAQPAQGGAFHLESGGANFKACSFVNNQVQGGLGGTGGDGGSGAIFSKGDLVLTGCILSSNACFGGSGVNFSGYTNTGPIPAGRGGSVCSLGSLTAVDSVFLSNAVAGGFNDTGPSFDETNSPVGGRGEGGAIYSSNALLLIRSTFAANQATGGHGSHPSWAGGAGEGGAIHAELNAVTLTNVTFAANQARGGLGLAYSGRGDDTRGVGGAGLAGAIFCDRVTLVGVNLTIADNQALGGNGAPNVLADMYRSAGDALGGGIFNTNASVILQNSIVANNLINTTNSSPENAYGPIIDGGNNISSDASCNFTNAASLNNTDPVLGPLGDYGGPTPTMPLLAGSPAIDRGNDAVAPPIDQRGHPRPFGAHSDTGAFESSPPYTIGGQVSSFWVVTNASVAAGAISVSPDLAGRFALDGLGPGDYTVTPALLGLVFEPTNQTVTVGPDVAGLAFKAYRFNGLTPEPSANSPGQIVFAAQPGQVWEIDRSTDLVNWQPLVTNTMPANGLLGFDDTVAGSNRYYRAKQP